MRKHLRRWRHFPLHRCRQDSRTQLPLDYLHWDHLKTKRSIWIAWRGKPNEETQAVRWFKQEGQDQYGESWRWGSLPCRLDEELSPGAEYFDEEEWGDEESKSDLGEVSGPEGDPEERIDGVADEVEEKRLQKMQVLEKPEGSTKGISCLTTCSVYD